MDDLFAGIEIASRALLSRPRGLRKLKFATVGSIKPIEVLKDLRMTLANGRNPPSLLWLLENFRTTRATIAHDQIYGLLGLCSPKEADWNPIRYDLEPHEAYKIYVETHVRLYNDIEFLGLCTPAQREASGSKTAGMPTQSFRGPSWVPNRHSTQLRRCLGLGKFSGKTNYFNASGSLSTNYSIKGDEMQVSGVSVDSIETLGDFVRLDRRSEISDPNSTLFEQYFDFWMEPGNRGKNEVFSQTIDQAESFARTLSLMGI